MNTNNPGNEKEGAASKKGGEKPSTLGIAMSIAAVVIAVTAMVLSAWYRGAYGPLGDANRAQACSLWFNGINDPAKAPPYCGLPEKWRRGKAAPSALPPGTGAIDDGPGYPTPHDSLKRPADAWECRIVPGHDGWGTMVCTELVRINR